LLFLPLAFHLQSVRVVNICTDRKADRQGKWTDRQKAARIEIDRQTGKDRLTEREREGEIHARRKPTVQIC
jgi:hypothetical protein